MAKSDPKKPKSKKSVYAFFVQTCKEHMKKNLEVPVNFAEISKKCSEKWKTMSGKEKSKFDEKAKADKVHYGQEMKDYESTKGYKNKKMTLMSPEDHCLDYSCSVQNSTPRSSSQIVFSPLEMWNNLRDSEKRSSITKGAKLKEKQEKDVADYESKGKFDSAKSCAKVARKRWKRKTRRRNKKNCLSSFLSIP
ncbi:High mobility group protein B3 [Sciurus carolinensis]|uniref:High mobility group protein B3 n=1 Tax=Sciurus carolinensis TaxID=30640 RepID=A0AA41NDS2_SCICA|nr:High mobility group protein B3 [Sciurus carolinensis]